MRHRIKGKKLNRNNSSRKALLQTLSRSLIEHGEIETTEVKAKYLRPYFEKLVSISRNNTLVTRRRLISDLQNRELAEKLLLEIGPANKNRPGGYTRIRSIGKRKGDVSNVVQISIIDKKIVEKKSVDKKGDESKKKTDKKEVKSKEASKKEVTSSKKESKK